MTKIRTILKSSKLADGKQQVLLMLSDRGARCYFTTGFEASSHEFDEGKEAGRFIQGRGVRSFNVERKEEDGSTKVYTNKEANDKLAEIEQRAKDILKRYNDNHVDWGFDMFRSDFVNSPKREKFSSYAEDIIEKEYRSMGHHKSAVIATEALQSLRNFDSQFDNRSFHDISVKYLNEYSKYCRNKGNSDTTLKIRLGEIRRFFNIAIREKVITQEIYPFSSGREDGKIRIPKTSPNKTDQYLTPDSLLKISTAKFENFVLDRTRHLFLFSYYCRGMNWKDMALLRTRSFYPKSVTNETTHETTQVTVMEYRRSKTKGEFEIQVTPRIQQELDWFKANTPLYKDYVLPIIRVDVTPDKLDSYIAQVRKRFNHSLREMATILQLPESQKDITIYTARHSFAMTLQSLDKPVEIISQALGHQSVETTKHYLAKFSTTKMAEETDIDLLAINASKSNRETAKIKEAPVQEQEP